jgi:3-hexulose-6-phosphate synthase / 6-phospho-3-hexuloisomerase
MSARRQAWKQEWPQIQVALDLLNIEDALHIAGDAYRAGIRWIEAGTPLIKSEGIRSVMELKKALPAATVVADMKTLDAGEIETEMAYEAGADVVSISGLAHDSTIKGSVKVKNRFDRRLMVDLLMASSPVRRARQLERLGADIVCLHTGVDAQKVTRSSIKVSPMIPRLSRTLRIPLAAAGGITPHLAPKLVAVGVKILIVGSWITGAKDPYRAARDIVASVRSGDLDEG